MNKVIQYFVEGECEEKFINVFKMPPYCYLKPGKVEVLNPVNAVISKAKALSLRQGTVVIFVYDVDKGNLDLLKENIKTLQKYSLTKIIHVQSITNFEHEIIRSTSISNINQVFGSEGVEEFKKKFIDHKNIGNKLSEIDFNIEKFWTTIRKNKFSEFLSLSDQKFIKK